MKTHLNLSPMITLDHLGEPSVLNFHISYIEDNAYFKFEGVWGGGGGGGGGFPLFLKFPPSIMLLLVFSISFF